MCVGLGRCGEGEGGLDKVCEKHKQACLPQSYLCSQTRIRTLLLCTCFYNFIVKLSLYEKNNIIFCVNIMKLHVYRGNTNIYHEYD